MISIIDPSVVSHVLRPTVYRATDAKVDPSDERREPPKRSVESNRGFTAESSDARLAART